MGRTRRFDGELGRRPWYQLEGRHAGVLAGRLAAAAVLATLGVVPSGPPASRDAVLALAACAAQALVQVVLWLVPRGYPRRLRLAVDLGLIADAVWAAALAHAWGGPFGPLAGAFLVTALWAALGYSARTGLKAAVLSSLGFLLLVWYADGGRLWSGAALGRLGFFWGVLAAAIAGAAAGERDLRLRAERLAVLHDAARGLLAADGREAMNEVARSAAERLMPGWRARVRIGPAAEGVRLVRAGDEGVVIVPVAVDDQLIGAIECRRSLTAGRVRHQLRLRDVAGLETVAANLGSALWRVHLIERIERQSLTDGLTGLANRRAFDVELQRRLDESRRHERPLALCFIDVDHFKSFNDTFGHLAGDETLAAVAATLAATCRDVDIPARYGGEEMAVLLPAATLEDALAVAQRIRAAVAAIELSTRPVTVSIGVAATDGDCSAELLIEAADRGVYAAKEGGRNRVVAGPSPRAIMEVAESP